MCCSVFQGRLRKNGEEFPVEVGLNPVEADHDFFVLAAIVDITERKHAEEMIRLAVEASPNGMVMTDHNGIIIMINSTTEELFGYPREELVGQSIDILTPDSFRKHHPVMRDDYLNHPEARAMGHGRDLFGRHKSGREFPVEIGLNPIRTPRGIMVLASVIDITERKTQEEQLKSALKEKELLLAEIHHRVKNNLQIIESLLGMQSDIVPDAAAVSILKESQNRVKSMALIHQVLYESQDFSRVDFSCVIQNLVDNLKISYALEASKIEIAMNVEQVYLPLDTSIPLGLIVNELCSNALKHAFPDNCPGKLEISFEYLDSNSLGLVVSDNGVGIPEEFDMENTTSLGLQLIQLLSKQISADLSIQRSKPTKFKLIIPLNK
jgi:two-component system, sensor histidine kinase PdtaS